MFKFLWIVLLFANESWSRVAIAPTSVDHRLINPAAAIHRDFRGVSLDRQNQVDQEKVLGLSRSSIEIKTEIETYNLNLILPTGKVIWELSVSPQKGRKITNSKEETDSGPNSNDSESNLSIVPAQILTSFGIGQEWSVGIKAVSNQYDFSDAAILNLNTPTTSEEINDSKKLKGSIMVVAPGLLYRIGNSGFSLGVLSEFYQFKNQVDQTLITERGSFGGVGVAENSEKTLISDDQILARKDVFGLGYLKEFSGKNSLRMDLSFERMPPLTKVQGYPFGEIYRFFGEINFLYFKVGAEVVQRKGYFVDAYNLIPYFFKIDHLGTEAVQENKLFGGLKTSMGHTFSVSYSQSTSTNSQKLSVESAEQTVETKSTKMGLSYGYYF